MKKTFILFFLPYVLFLPQTLFGQSVEEIKQIVKPFGLVKEEFIGGKSDRFIIFIAQQHELDLTFPFNIMITDTGSVKIINLSLFPPMNSSFTRPKGFTICFI